MIDFEYAGRHVRGVWRMAIGAPDWTDDVDRSVDGVFRSFWAIALATPFALLAFHSAARAARLSPRYAETVFAKAPAPLIISAEMLGFIASWAASVAALGAIARALKESNHAASLIVTYNWSQLLTMAVASVPAALLAVTGATELFVLLALPAIAFSFFVLWGVLRRNLSITVGVAISLIALLTLIELLINAATTQGAVALIQLLS